MGTPLISQGGLVGADFSTLFQAATGARGSFNYADTSRYGPGELRDENARGAIIIPGTGGGATTKRRTPGSIFGGGSSRNEGMFITGGALMSVPGSSPNGVVVIRLTRIE